MHWSQKIIVTIYAFYTQEGDEIDLLCDSDGDGGGGDLSAAEAKERQPRPPMQ